MVDEKMAAAAWPGEKPVGRRVRLREKAEAVLGANPLDAE